MRVAITGASGFVGRHLVSDFAARGALVSAVSRRPIDNLPQGACWVRSPDLGRDADWRDTLAGIDVVVHAAARVHVMQDRSVDPLAAFRATNVDGTVALAEQAAAAGVRLFAFISSIKVNGEQTVPGRPFRADDSPAPVDPYGVSKAEAEAALFAIADATRLTAVVIRPVLVYGPGVGANFALMLRAVARGLPLPLGAIDNRRSLLFVGNLTDLVWRTAVHPGPIDRVLLASDGEDLSTPHMLRRLGQVSGQRVRLPRVPIWLLSLAARLSGKRDAAHRLLGSLQVDIGPTVRALDWTPPFGVNAGFAATASGVGE